MTATDDQVFIVDKGSSGASRTNRPLDAALSGGKLQVRHALVGTDGAPVQPASDGVLQAILAALGLSPGARDDGTPYKVLRTELARGAYEAVPMPPNLAANNYTSGALCNWNYVDAGTGSNWVNPDSTGMEWNIAVTANPALGTYALMNFDIVGNVFGLRWNRKYAGNGNHPFSCRIDGIVRRVNVSPLLIPETQTGDVNKPTGYFDQIIATDLGEGEHHVELHFPVHPTINRNWSICGMILDSKSAIALRPIGVCWLNQAPVPVPSGDPAAYASWMTVFPQGAGVLTSAQGSRALNSLSVGDILFTKPNLRAIKSYEFYNSNGSGTATVRMRVSLAAGGVAKAVQVPAGTSQPIKPDDLVWGPLDFNADTAGVTMAIQGVM